MAQISFDQPQKMGSVEPPTITGLNWATVSSALNPMEQPSLSKITLNCAKKIDAVINEEPSNSDSSSSVSASSELLKPIQPAPGMIL